MSARRRSGKATRADAAIREAAERMLEADETITARSVARRIGLRAASSITRDPVRRDLVVQFQRQQEGRRQWVRRSKKESTKKLESALAARDGEIARLTRQVDLLVASHKAMILAVGEVGGMRAWARFFKSWSASVEELRALGAIDEATPQQLPDRGS